MTNNLLLLVTNVKVLYYQFFMPHQGMVENLLFFDNFVAKFMIT